MVTYILIGLGLLGGFLLFARWYSRVDARTLLKVLKRIGIGLLAVAALLLIVTGRFGLALAAGAFLLPWAVRTLGTAGAGAGAYGGAGGRGRPAAATRRSAPGFCTCASTTPRASSTARS